MKDLNSDLVNNLVKYEVEKTPKLNTKVKMIE